MDVERKVKEWDSFMTTTPSFEEIRDVEFVRRSGRINMVTDNLMQELYDRGRFHGVLWLERCRQHRISWTSHYSPAIKYYADLHGSTDQWFTEELLTQWEEEELLRRERELKDQLRDLRNKKANRRRNA